MMTFLLILAAIFIIGLYLFIDFMLGRKRHLSSLKKNTLPLREGQIRIITEGTELFRDFFQEMKSAKHNIHTIFYICKSDSISQDFFGILIQKAQEGVEVRLLVDWVGGKSMKRKLIKELKKAGVHFTFARKPRLPFLFYSAQVRNHRKISIIDGSIGYVGGYNVGDEYIHLNPKLSPWRDYHMKITGEGVQDLQRQFLLDWNKATKVNLLQNPVYFPSLKKGPVRHRFFPSEGLHLEECFTKLIREAKGSIFIGTPYFVPSRTVFRELLKALERGVSCTVLLPLVSDHFLVREASFRFLRSILKRGARVFQYKRGFYHAKVMIVDDKICDLGTANFDNRSFFLNLEINCFIYEPSVIREVNRILQHDLLDSKHLTLKDLQGFHPLRALKEYAARTIAFFL